MSDRIKTLHADDGQSGVNIDRTKYYLLRETIISILEKENELTFGELGAEVNERLEGRFEGSISWYYTTVKLGLQARGIIERAGPGSPQRIRLMVA